VSSAAKKCARSATPHKSITQRFKFTCRICLALFRRAHLVGEARCGARRMSRRLNLQSAAWYRWGMLRLNPFNPLAPERKFAPLAAPVEVFVVVTPNGEVFARIDATEATARQVAIECLPLLSAAGTWSAQPECTGVGVRISPND
jgi:hypothetical protein